MSKPKTPKRPTVVIHETNQPSPAAVARALRRIAAMMAAKDRKAAEAEPLRPAA